MNGILSQYLMRTIIASTALVLVVLLAIAGLFDFIAELDDTQGNYQTPQAILFTALTLPLIAFEMLPVAVLIGSLLGLGALAGNSEIIVMRSAGLSAVRLGGMVAITGTVLLVVTALLGEFIGPPLDLYARNMRVEARTQQTGDRVGNEAWVKDGPVFLHLERVNSEFRFGSVYLFRFDRNNGLESIALAGNSGIDQNDNWVLENFRETRFSNDGVQVAESSLAVESFNINAEMLGVSLVKPASLTARGLANYIDYLKRNSLDAARYQTELWYRISRTASVIIMPVLALAFVFGSLRTGGAGSRLMIGIGVGLAYYLGSEMLANSSQVFDLNPAIIAWFPTGVLFILTLFALTRVR